MWKSNCKSGTMGNRYIISHTHTHTHTHAHTHTHTHTRTHAHTHIYVGCDREKNRETVLLSLQACFVIAYSSGDFIVKNIRTIVYIRSGSFDDCFVGWKGWQSTARATTHQPPQRTYPPASTKDCHPFHPTKHLSTKPLLHNQNYSTNADTGTPYTTNHPRLTTEKTDNGTTYSGTTPHSAKTSEPISDTDSLP